MTESLTVAQQVIAALRKITRAIDLHSRCLLKQCGLTAPQLVALKAIDRLEPISVGALAREIHLGQATVTGILQRLEDRELVLRSRGDEDRRTVFTSLTAEGRRIARNAPFPLQERFHRELSTLQEWEQTQILATLQRIAAMMGADDIQAAPLLVSGAASAPAEDVSDYLEKAVLPADELPVGQPRPAEAAEDPLAELNPGRSDAGDATGRERCEEGGEPGTCAVHGP
jgi:DNA-binding MarR family transcriptional regulator